MHPTFLPGSIETVGEAAFSAEHVGHTLESTKLVKRTDVKRIGSLVLTAAGEVFTEKMERASKGSLLSWSITL